MCSIVNEFNDSTEKLNIFFMPAAQAYGGDVRYS
jgi:hypothetical protein